jgi:DNA-binding NarL/FixJ family response regulator
VSAANGSSAGPRVLLADDQSGIRESLGNLLRDEGFAVVGEAADGVAAVAAAEQLRPDVVLMDLRMPRLNGIQAAERIRAQLPGTAVVIFTAYDDPGLEEGATAAGVTAYLVKGCPPDDILHAVADAARGA